MQICYVTVMCRRDRWQLDWPGGASSRRSVRSVARLAPLKALLAKQSDKSLRHYLDAPGGSPEEGMLQSLALNSAISGVR